MYPNVPNADDAPGNVYDEVLMDKLLGARSPCPPCNTNATTTTTTPAGSLHYHLDPYNDEVRAREREREGKESQGETRIVIGQFAPVGNTEVHIDMRIPTLIF